MSVSMLPAQHILHSMPVKLINRSNCINCQNEEPESLLALLPVSGFKAPCIQPGRSSTPDPERQAR
jgi:hypothetical protein